MGLRHGLFCLGCCWALMALLFVGGLIAGSAAVWQAQQQAERERDVAQMEAMRAKAVRMRSGGVMCAVHGAAARRRSPGRADVVPLRPRSHSR